MNFWDTEAEHLTEIYDGAEYDAFEPYSRLEKREYIREKARFNKADVGKYVIVQKTRKNKDVVEKLYLVDRSKTTRFWWSHDAFYAMKFESKDAAIQQAEKYRYNKVRVVQIVNNINL